MLPVFQITAVGYVRNRNAPVPPTTSGPRRGHLNHNTQQPSTVLSSCAASGKTPTSASVVLISGRRCFPSSCNMPVVGLPLRQTLHIALTALSPTYARLQAAHSHAHTPQENRGHPRSEITTQNEITRTNVPGRDRAGNDMTTVRRKSELSETCNALIHAPYTQRIPATPWEMDLACAPWHSSYEKQCNA